MTQPTVFNAYFYHDKCTDGLIAMAIAHQFIPKDEYHTIVPCVHGEIWDYDWVEGLDLLFLDFSFPRDIMESIIQKANTVTIIDHHVSAYEDINDMVRTYSNVTYIYDVNQSGAGLAWEYFYPQYEKPLLVKLVEDRDIWTKKYEESDALVAALRTRRYFLRDAINLVADIVDEIKTNAGGDNGETTDLIEIGQNFIEERQAITRGIASYGYTAKLDDGTQVIKVNCPPGFISEVGAYIAEKMGGNGIAWLFYELEHKTIHSLRVSKESLFDAASYAKDHGGGGHRKAAGWSVSK